MPDVGSARRRFFDGALGVGLAFLFALGVSTLVLLTGGALDRALKDMHASGDGGTAAAHLLVFLFNSVGFVLEFIGITQLVYIVPAVLMARRRGRAGIATGLIWGAALIFLLNAAYWFLVYLLKGFHL